MNRKFSLLEKRDYFYCEKNSCSLRVEVCLKRQEANRDKIVYFPCYRCVQGGGLYSLKENNIALFNRNPVAGKGRRALECPYYSTCLNLVADRDWDSFNCDECQYVNEKLFANNAFDSTKVTSNKQASQNENDAPDIATEMAVEREEAGGKAKAPASAVTLDFNGYLPLLGKAIELAEIKRIPVENMLLGFINRYMGRMFRFDSRRGRHVGTYADDYMCLVSTIKNKIWASYIKSLRGKLNTHDQLTVTETALLMEIGENEVYRRIDDGQLEVVQNDQVFRIKTSSVRSLVAPGGAPGDI